jgi:RNA polymerase sigma factor (sigma-70 family)
LSTKLSYIPDEHFSRFLDALERREQREWNWLITEFRKKLIPFLRKRTQSYPSNALLSRDQFLEEVIEETLLQFYQIFGKGSFESYGNLEAAAVTTAGYKLMEGFTRLKKEQKMYFMEGDALSAMRERMATVEERAKVAESEKIAQIKEKLNDLNSKDKDLLMRYFGGEELQDIADDLEISPAACRKRKQRIVEKLKNLVLKAFTIFILLFL